MSGWAPTGENTWRGEPGNRAVWPPKRLALEGGRRPGGCMHTVNRSLEREDSTIRRVGLEPLWETVEKARGRVT